MPLLLPPPPQVTKSRLFKTTVRLHHVLKFVPVIACALAMLSCSTEFQPKPLGYNRLVLPEPAYQSTPDTLPYSFEYSKHAVLLKDTSWISEKNWVEVYYPALKANIHITYKEVRTPNDLKDLVNDAFVLTSKQQVKANAIDEVVVTTPTGNRVVIAEVTGEVPSQFQFTLTDTTLNFFRGAVYFFTKVNNDSLAPAIDYVKKDAMHLVNTIRFRKAGPPMSAEWRKALGQQ